VAKLKGEFAPLASALRGVCKSQEAGLQWDRLGFAVAHRRGAAVHLRRRLNIAEKGVSDHSREHRDLAMHGLSCGLVSGAQMSHENADGVGATSEAHHIWG
jgi:hypothetical protein